MGGFSFVIDTILFLQCDLMFESNFSLANWEPMRQIAEQFATALFNDHLLQEKHKYHLKKLGWDNSLGNRKRCCFTPVTRDSWNARVRLPNGLLLPTPHHLFVDNDIYRDIFDSFCIQQVVAASIKAIYILLGGSDLSKQQDPISFDTLEDMPVSYSSHFLGQIVNTQCMDVKKPPEFIADTIQLLKNHSACTRKLSSYRISNQSLRNFDTWCLLPPGYAPSCPISMQKSHGALRLTKITAL